jgi:threonine dehydratase
LGSLFQPLFTIDDVQAMRARIAPYIVSTPVIEANLGGHVDLKLELFQRSGSFKVRGALANALSLPPESLRRGLVAVSAGNHAIAVAHVAKLMGTSATVVMPVGVTNPFRVETCRALGANVELVEGRERTFERAQEIVAREGRSFIHPFDSRETILGTATLGLEILENLPESDTLIAAVGGGGLLAGIAFVAKSLRPKMRIFGVEPRGAALMRLSLDKGEPQRSESVGSVADSLTPPYAGKLTFEYFKRYVDDVVVVEDNAITQALRDLYSAARIAVEPSAAAPLAGWRKIQSCGGQGTRPVLVISGANIEASRYAELLSGDR